MLKSEKDISGEKSQKKHVTLNVRNSNEPYARPFLSR